MYPGVASAWTWSRPTSRSSTAPSKSSRVQGKGSTFVISLPLTLAILPVLLVQLGDQPFAVPLSMVREILPIEIEQVQEVGGCATMVVRGEVMPMFPLITLLGWASERVPEYGVLMQTAEHHLHSCHRWFHGARGCRDQVAR